MRGRDGTVAGGAMDRAGTGALGVDVEAGHRTAGGDLVRLGVAVAVAAVAMGRVADRYFT